MTENSYDVFLSHHRNDNNFVTSIANLLREKAGLKPFWDTGRLLPGDLWQEEIETALKCSAVCAVFLGPSGLGPWQNTEMRMALNLRISANSIRIIPVLLPMYESKDDFLVPISLREFGYVDFRGGIDDQGAFDRLVAGIRGYQSGNQLVSGQALKDNTVWVITLSGMFNDVDKPRIEGITNLLRKITGDLDLVINKVEKGSIKLTIESSNEGFERIVSAYEQGVVSEVAGLKILSIDLLVNSVRSKDLTDDTANSAKILLVENSEGYRDTVQEFLEDNGFRVYVASDLSAAKAILNREDLSLIVSDIRLVDDTDENDQSGLMFVREIDPAIPKIILTAFPSYQMVREAMMSASPNKMGIVAKTEGLYTLLNKIQFELA